MKALSLVGALVAPFVSFCSQADVPMIRFAAEAPFRDGACVEAAWAKADVCARFVEVIRNDVALDQSEARLLFDERNLYVALKGNFDPQYDRGDAKKGLDSVNNFEFLLKPPAKEYLHVIVDEFGRLYVGKGKTEARDTGVTASVAKGKGFWTANLTVPLKALDMSAPTADTSVKVGVFRWNINVHERAKLHAKRGTASGLTPNDYDFGVPDLWADMVFTRTGGEVRRVTGPTFGRRVNLFPNPDFDVPNERISRGRTLYAETMAMSGEWAYRCSGKDYLFVQLGAQMLKPRTRYTLVVKARSFGSGSGLRVVQLARGKDGKVHEGAYATFLTPLGPELHEYYLPFTTDADESWSMAFFKVDDKSDDTGVELAAVRCYEGELSSFEIRKQTRPGRMALVPGTEIPVGPNPIGRFAKPLNVLAFVSSKYALREPEEIFAGTGVSLDTVLLSDKGADVYSTLGDPEAVSGRVSGGRYDLVMVPVNGAEKIGREMAKHIRACVENGGGLYLEAQPKGLGFLEPIVGEAKGGSLGKGRVLRAKTAGGGCQYLPGKDDREQAVSLFPADVARMRVAAAAWRTATGAASAVPAARCETRTLVYAGKRHVFTKKLDAHGATLDWTESAVPVAGPTLGAFADDGKVSTVVVTGDVTDVTLAWEFRDFSGRILAEKEVEVEERGRQRKDVLVSFVVPREKLYTNFGGIRLALRKDGKEIDVRGEAIFVRDNDRRRLMDDYTASMWPGDGGAAEMRQLEEIGIRASILPCAGGSRPARTIAAGFGTGSGWLGDGSMFCGWKQKTNVRTPNFNTGKWRAEKPASVRRAVERTREYGLLNHALCDEPNLSAALTADEVDAHPENLVEYRIRMERKYGTIAKYNRRHGTAHKSFADLGQALQADARKTKKYAEFIEWRNFNVDRWCEAIRLVSDNARAVDDAPFTACNSYGESALSGNDYWKLYTCAGQDFAVEYTALVYYGRKAFNNFDEFIRSFRPDMRCWGWVGYGFSTPRARFLPWWTACHRYGGFAWYAATIPGWNIVDAATCARTVEGEELRRTLADSRMLDGLGKVLTCWDWAARDVAIYYSHESLMLSTLLGNETRFGQVETSGPLHDHLYSRQGAQYTVEDLLYQHDFVAPQQIVGKVKGKGEGEQSNEFLSSYKVLFMPRILAMSDAEVAAVKAFLAKGGKAICDELPGGYDELGVKRAANPFAGVAGIAVLGRNFDDLDKDCRTAVKGFLEAAGATKALGCDDMVAHFGREAMHYVSGDADVYAVIRMPGRSEDDDALDFTFAKKGHVYDVRAQKYLGETDRVTAKTVLPEASVFAVLPAKVTGIGISGLPAKVAAGVDLSLDFLIGGGRDGARPSQASVPSYVLHVEVVPPSGKARFHMKRNLLTEGGKAHLDFAMALNDEKGTWRLRVTEPLTGMTAEKPFELGR